MPRALPPDYEFLPSGFVDCRDEIDKRMPEHVRLLVDKSFNQCKVLTCENVRADLKKPYCDTCRGRFVAGGVGNKYVPAFLRGTDDVPKVAAE